MFGWIHFGCILKIIIYTFPAAYIHCYTSSRKTKWKQISVWNCWWHIEPHKREYGGRSGKKKLPMKTNAFSNKNTKRFRRCTEWIINIFSYLLVKCDKTTQITQIQSRVKHNITLECVKSYRRICLVGLAKWHTDKRECVCFIRSQNASCLC